MAASADNAKTITVVSNTSLRVGQVIFETSDRTCCINLKGLVVAIIQFFLFKLAFKPIRVKIQVHLWQGQQGSNPRPTVLETAALPTELYPYVALPNHHIYEFQPIISYPIQLSMKKL